MIATHFTQHGLVNVKIAGRLYHNDVPISYQAHRLDFELATEFRYWIVTLRFQKHVISVSAKAAAAHLEHSNEEMATPSVDLPANLLA